MANLSFLIWSMWDVNKPRCNQGAASLHAFGLEVNFWYVWFGSVLLAFLLVYSLWYDKYNHYKTEMDTIANNPNFSEEWRQHEQASHCRAKMWWFWVFNWGLSQFLWIFILKSLVMTFDCTFVYNIAKLNGDKWTADYLSKNPTYTVGDVVMDEDRSMQCFAGLHQVLSGVIGILLLFFVCLSLPLLVGLGDSRLVHMFPEWCTFKAQQQQWPSYAGAFTRHRWYYWFETTLMAAKILLPVAGVLTTYIPKKRYIWNVLVGLVLFFVASYAPPASRKNLSRLIIVGSLILFGTPVYNFYIYEEDWNQGANSCAVADPNLTTFPNTTYLV